MTRFERELSGSLGAYWKASAEKEIRKMEERQMNGEIFFGADGVVRWTSNNRVMPKDCREILSHTAYRDLFSEEASRAAEEAETEESAGNKRRTQPQSDGLPEGVLRRAPGQVGRKTREEQDRGEGTQGTEESRENGGHGNRIREFTTA